MAITPSRFIRHDLMATDVPSAVRFYAELFAWQMTEVKVMGFTIVRLTLEDQVLGAIMPFDKALGHPSHWVPYVQVESVEECCRRVSTLGGTVCMGAMDIPPGRFALVNDPEEALFSPFTPKSPPPAEPASPRAAARPGAFCWDELLARDVGRAKAFYTSLFGWGSQERDMGPAGTYTLLLRGEAPVAGITKLPASAAQAARWLPYVEVESADAAADRAARLGATITAAPADVPEVGRFAVLRDPSDAGFAILARS